jgi:predicted homoserine dehydrogenase-like protein
MITTAMLRELSEKGLRVGLIGAGKFGTMFLNQARRAPGLQIAAVADLAPARARASLASADWPESQYAAASLAEALERGSTWLTDDAQGMIASDGLDVIVDATGNPAAGARHALACARHGRHIVMVNVEADVLVGPLLAQRFASAGLAYSLAYGDQPALIVELVDWARACGLEVVCAGKGTRYMPHFHQSDHSTVWEYHGFAPEVVAKGGFNPKMFNSFIDGTKAAIEMAAVANACGLRPQPHGLGFPPCGIHDLPQVLRPSEHGGQLSHGGTVEVVSSLERDGRKVHNDIQVGVFVTFEGHNEYARRCFVEYGVKTDSSGRFASLYRPYHLIGLELAVSVILAGLRGESTGAPRGFAADVVATAKRDLPAGTQLDGEGGVCVYGKLRPAEASLQHGELPIGLAHDVTLTRDVKAGEVLRWDDVRYDDEDETVKLRKEMEHSFTAPASA